MAKYKERKQLRKEIERFVESVTNDSDITLTEVDMAITYTDSEGMPHKIGNSIRVFEGGD